MSDIIGCKASSFMEIGIFFQFFVDTVMHFYRGIDGNRASASKLTRYSSFKVISLRLWTNSIKFLHV